MVGLWPWPHVIWQQPDVLHTCHQTKTPHILYPFFVPCICICICVYICTSIWQQADMCTHVTKPQCLTSYVRYFPPVFVFIFVFSFVFSFIFDSRRTVCTPVTKPQCLKFHVQPCIRICFPLPCVCIWTSLSLYFVFPYLYFVHLYLLLPLCSFCVGRQIRGDLQPGCVRDQKLPTTLLSHRVQSWH